MDNAPFSRRGPHDLPSQHLSVLWCLLLWLSLMDVTRAATPLQLELLLSDDGPAYQQLAGSFQAELGIACANRCPVTPSVKVSRVTDWNPTARRDLLIPVGSLAAGQAAAARADAVLYGLIPEDTWRSLTAARQPGAAPVSAVFLDQPAARQFRLLTLALPQARRVGVLLGPESGYREPALRRAASAQGLELHVRHVREWTGVGPAVEALSDEIDVLLAVPDSMVFNRDTLYGILITSYRARVPVVGYSRALVNAGAMLGLYTSLPNMARQLAQYSADYITDRQLLPPPAASRYFEIAVNDNVARSLRFALPDPAQLRRNLARQPAGGPAQ